MNNFVFHGKKGMKGIKKGPGIPSFETHLRLWSRLFQLSTERRGVTRGVTSFFFSPEEARELIRCRWFFALCVRLFQNIPQTTLSRRALHFPPSCDGFEARFDTNPRAFYREAGAHIGARNCSQILFLTGTLCDFAPPRPSIFVKEKHFSGKIF